jgi:CheY-like chemotaxis protein
LWDPIESRFASGDEGKIRQILVNLIGNAIKFTKNGKIIVRCSVLLDKVGDKDQTRHCVISVEDTGIGISEEKINKVFDVFTQADASTTREYGGTGLGLSISRELANLMGGKLTAVSTLGKGSTFTLTVDLGRPEQLPSTSRSEVGEAAQALILTNDDLMFKCVASKLAINEIKLTRLVALDDLRTNTTGNVSILLDGAVLDDNPSILDSCTASVFVLGRTTSARETPEGYRHINPPYSLEQLTSALGPNTNSAIDEHLEHAGAATPVTKRPTVLLVEDVEVNQQIASSMLQSMGMTVKIAGNGAQAVEMFGTESYDLIFMDCQMPIVDGYQATRQIRQIEEGTPDKRTPIIALTAGGDETDKKRAYDAGMDGFVRKPFTTAELGPVLSEHLEIPQSEQGASIVTSISHETLGRKSGVDDETLDEEVMQSLSGLCPDADTELLAKLLAGFIGQFQEKCGQLESVTSSSDREILRTSAHAIKSMSANMGAKQIRLLADRLEKDAKTYDLTLLPNDLATLQDCCEIYIINYKKRFGLK